MEEAGGDPACWAHLVLDEGAGSRGAQTEELNATLVALERGGRLARAYVDRDIAITVVRGSGVLHLDDDVLALEPGVVVVVPAGSSRELVAHEDGLAWSSVHRRRERLGTGLHVR